MEQLCTCNRRRMQSCLSMLTTFSFPLTQMLRKMYLPSCQHDSTYNTHSRVELEWLRHYCVGGLNVKCGYSVERDRPFITSSLRELGLNDARGVETPAITANMMEEVHNYMKTTTNICDAHCFISVDRPDVQCFTTQLAKCVHNPVTPAWTALERCLRYLKKSGPMRRNFDGRVRKRHLTG